MKIKLLQFGKFIIISFLKFINVVPVYDAPSPAKFKLLYINFSPSTYSEIYKFVNTQ